MRRQASNPSPTGPTHSPPLSPSVSPSLSTSQVGNRNLILAMLAYLQAGYVPFDPVGDGTKADFVADPTPALAAQGARLERVQIKAARYRDDGAIDANLRVPSKHQPSSKRGRTSTATAPATVRYSRADIDAFALVTPDGRVFRIPVTEFAGELPTGVSLRLAPAKNNQTAGIRLASQYELPVTLAR